jgi:uncharacterized protein (UPF0248 family)
MLRLPISGNPTSIPCHRIVENDRWRV